MKHQDIVLDDISLLVTCPVTLKWLDLENHLQAAGYTLGYYHARKQAVRIRDLLQRNWPNTHYRQYGQPRDKCVSATFIGASGQIYATKRVPRTAAGPDFRRILLGSGHRYGELESVTLRIHPLPERIDWHWSYWPSSVEARVFVGEIEALDLRPNFAGVFAVEQQPRALHHEKMVLASLRFAGLDALVHCSVERAGAVMRRFNGTAVRIARKKIVPFLEQLMRET